MFRLAVDRVSEDEICKAAKSLDYLRLGDGHLHFVLPNEMEGNLNASSLLFQESDVVENLSFAENEEDVINGNADDTSMDFTADTESDSDTAFASLYAQPTLASTPRPMRDISNTVLNSIQETSRPRKRVRNQRNWAKNIRQRKRLNGEEYVNRKGAVTRARKVQPQDCSKCRLKCNTKLTDDDRQYVFNDFYRMTANGRQVFFAEFTKRGENNSRKRSGYKGLKATNTKYFFRVCGKHHQVCRNYFCKTLDISKTRIETFHKHKTTHTEMPDPAPRPFNGKQYTDEQVDEIRTHIKSLPAVDSHYCRKNSEKKYIDPDSYHTKLYNLYCEKQVAACKPVVKQWKYTEIVKTLFNVGFHHPKSDRCNKCEEYERKKSNKTLANEEIEEYNTHRQRREDTKQARHADRSLSPDQSMVISFDLENIFALHKCDVSQNFYKRKFTTYNLTAIVQHTKQVYCSVWSENLSGRSGNDIASALIEILRKIKLDHPTPQHWIIWSDSCISQNKNSHMSLALQLFLDARDHLSITQRFCEPGHSSIQEIDAVHSVIERYLKSYQIYSPVTVIRHFKNIKPMGKPMDKIQLKRASVMDYSEKAEIYKYSVIKYKKLRQLKYEKGNIGQVSASYSFSSEFERHQIIRPTTLRNGRSGVVLPKVRELKKEIKLSQAKVNDLKSMLVYMEVDDRRFYQTVWGETQ